VLSIRVATVRGIPIRLHITLLATFALLIATLGPVFGIVAGVLLFGSVLLHELGHSVVAQRFGIRIASIDLHLLGGMALMTRPPRSATEEVKIAVAGPVVSLLLSAFFFSMTPVLHAPLRAAFAGPITGAALLSTLPGYLNLMMCFFNMIPALPMDGGRIFRAVLSARVGPLRATRIAARVSRIFAIAFVVVGVIKQAWSLCILAPLLFLMVGNEERIAEAQEALRERAESPHPYAFEPYAPLARARGDGPVIDQNGKIVGETREEFIDRYGRRYVVITRLSPSA
jgi:Zn-dependent protease